MCNNMDELQVVSEEIYNLEQKKSKKKKEIADLDKKISQLKNEAIMYMKRRRKKELTVAGLAILFTAWTRKSFDKEAFIAEEKDGEETYNKYLKQVNMERLTVKVVETK